MEITQGETFPFGKVSPFFCALFPASAGMVPGLVRTAPFPAVILVPSALFVPVSRSTRGAPGTARDSTDQPCPAAFLPGSDAVCWQATSQASRHLANVLQRRMNRHFIIKGGMCPPARAGDTERTMQSILLNDGHSIPSVGFGVFQVPADGSTFKAVLCALQAGYRHIDTAAAYLNEAEVGQALRESGLPRDEVFVTSKLWIQDYGYEAARAGIRASLDNLGLDCLDLYLLHQPYFDVQGAWKALEEARDEGLVKSIGVSNFTPNFWKRHVPHFATLPCLNQVEFHPFFQQRELRALLARDRVALAAWSPLGHGNSALLAHPLVTALAGKYHCDPCRLILRFELQEGCIVLPKSTSPAHIASNLRLFDFCLDEGDMERLRGLDTGRGMRDPEEAGRAESLLARYRVHP